MQDIVPGVGPDPADPPAAVALAAPSQVGGVEVGTAAVQARALELILAGREVVGSGHRTADVRVPCLVWTKIVFTGDMTDLTI